MSYPLPDAIYLLLRYVDEACDAPPPHSFVAPTRHARQMAQSYLIALASQGPGRANLRGVYPSYRGGVNLHFGGSGNRVITLIPPDADPVEVVWIGGPGESSSKKDAVLGDLVAVLFLHDLWDGA